MDRFLPTLLDALAVGSLYALIALGYTMVYGILKFINFAHSDVFVLGAWISYSAAVMAGFTSGENHGPAVWVFYVLAAVLAGGVIWSGVGLARTRAAPPQAKTLLFVGVWGFGAIGLVYAAKLLRGAGMDIAAGGVILVVAMLTCGLVGFCLERLAYKPLRGAPRLNVLITAIGVSLFLQNVGQLDWMFGTRPQGMPALLPDRVLVELGSHAATATEAASGGVRIRLLDVICGGTALLLMLALDRLVFATRLGRAMRAVSYNERNAALMGIPVDRIISFTFVLGAMLAAAAGFLYAQKYPGINQTAAPVWTLLGLKAFVAAVIGGIGNIRGAMLGGLLIGLLEFFTRAYIPQGTQLCDVVVFGALIVVLLVRPAGILGTPVQDKV